MVIIGAGAAGLAAAKVLAGARVRFALLEARDRAGGRVMTLRAAGMPIELGAEFVHGRPRATFRELRAAGLTARRVPSERAGPDGDDGGASWGDLKRILRRLGPKGPDVPFSTALARLRGETAGRKAAAARFIQGFDAADLDVVSARDVAESAGQIDGAWRSYRIEEGYDAVIRALRRSVPRGALVTRAVVERIAWGGSEVRVGLRGGRELSARAALVTLPVGVLRAPRGAEGAVRFVPALPPAKRRAIANLRMGGAARVVLLFKAASWPRLEAGFRAPFLDAPDGLFSVYWTAAPFDRPLVTAWAGGPPAFRLGRMPRSKMVAEAVGGLARALRMPAAEVRAALREAFFHDWPGDPFSRGAYSYLEFGGEGARAALAEPCGRLFFAGEACDAEGESGTVAGALESGRKGAEALLDYMKKDVSSFQF